MEDREQSGEGEALGPFVNQGGVEPGSELDGVRLRCDLLLAHYLDATAELSRGLVELDNGRAIRGLRKLLALGLAAPRELKPLADQLEQRVFGHRLLDAASQRQAAERIAGV